MGNRKSQVAVERIESRIFFLRGQKVVLSTHLAELYQVEPRALVQAVKRNIKRFPSDFMFILSSQECENLKSQFVISSWGGLRRAAPYAFTEQGVAMLSSVLRSNRAIQVNIEIMREAPGQVWKVCFCSYAFVDPRCSGTKVHFPDLTPVPIALFKGGHAALSALH